jgi:hypothetical protein
MQPARPIPSSRRSRSVGVAAVLVALVMLGGCGQKGVSLKLADQKICAAQAEHIFMSDGWRLAGSVTRVGSRELAGSYTSHYNDRARKCFMELFAHFFDTSTQVLTNSAVLSDAFEGTPYATYTESLSGNQVHIDECNLTLPNSPPLRCGSRAEWNALVQPYIEARAIAR